MQRLLGRTVPRQSKRPALSDEQRAVWR